MESEQDMRRIAGIKSNDIGKIVRKGTRQFAIGRRPNDTPVLAAIDGFVKRVGTVA
jgi:hypothetical protein